MASLKWAATHSTLFSGVQKYLLPYNNGNSKLEFLNNSRSIKVFVTSNFQVEPFEILKINLSITLHVSQMVDFVQNEKFKNITFSFPPTKSPWHHFQSVYVQNMTPSQLNWCHTDEIGQFNILTLS